MAATNLEQVGKALALLKEGLRPFVEQKLGVGFDASLNWDTHRLLAVIWEQWNPVFGRTLGRVERTLVSELRDVRNRWAHEEPFSTDDAYRTVDSVVRLLKAVSAPEAVEAERQKQEILGTLSKEKAGKLEPIKAEGPSMKPKFSDMHGLLRRKGPATVESSRGTIYRIEASVGANGERIVAFLEKGGRITVHEDCWLKSKTCQGTWAGGIYNGPHSILHWYAENS